MLERLLARSAANSSAASVRLRYLDVPLVEHDSVHATWRAAGVTPVFAVRCPVLPAPAARASLSLLGADAFANLMLCAASAP